MLTDTHVHLDGLIEAGHSLDAIVSRAVQAYVSGIVAVGGSPAANRTAVAAARAYPGLIRAAAGYNRDLASSADVHHPSGSGEMMDDLASILDSPDVAAVGEIGLDFHHGRETAEAQMEWFGRQLLMARERRLPVSVHTREAEAETLSVLREHAAAWRGAPGRIGVMHCFTGGEAFVRDLLALGFCISFSGILTFKNAREVRAVAAAVPEDRLLIETDSPYLAPEPFRGQVNEPAHVRRVADALAALRHTTWQAVAELTSRNAERVFGKSE